MKNTEEVSINPSISTQPSKDQTLYITAGGSSTDDDEYFTAETTTTMLRQYYDQVKMNSGFNINLNVFSS